MGYYAYRTSYMYPGLSIIQFCGILGKAQYQQVTYYFYQEKIYFAIIILIK
jgi:hypothetical protein